MRDYTMKLNFNRDEYVFYEVTSKAQALERYLQIIDIDYPAELRGDFDKMSEWLSLNGYTYYKPVVTYIALDEPATITFNSLTVNEDNARELLKMTCPKQTFSTKEYPGYFEVKIKIRSYWAWKIFTALEQMDLLTLSVGEK